MQRRRQLSAFPNGTSLAAACDPALRSPVTFPKKRKRQNRSGVSKRDPHTIIPLQRIFRNNAPEFTLNLQKIPPGVCF
jgi:hypothetical protein